MSYNYDLNPWDDNYQQQAAPAAGGGQQSGYGQTAAASNAYGTSGYSNPSAQYQDSWNDQGQQQQHYDDGANYSQQDGGQPPDQAASQTFEGGEKAPPPPPPPSFLGRLLGPQVSGMCTGFMDLLFSTVFKFVNRDLLVSKVFYFFFYSAFGSLFPLMGVYFKQLGMNPAQVGIITGVRPFIEIFSAPFWNSLAERFQKSKVILLFSLISWIVFTYSLAHIRPPASACVAFNDTDYVLYTPYSANDLSNYDVGQLDEVDPAAAAAAAAATASSSPSAQHQVGNEMFMNKMPANLANREGKDEILVNEENVNDQGRRRRRRRRRKRSAPGGGSRSPRVGDRLEQIERPSLGAGRSRYTYSLVDTERKQRQLESNELDSHLDLDIDLEHDFEDAPLARAAGGGGEAQFFDPVDSGPEYGGAGARSDESDELEQQLEYANRVRNKRHLRRADEDEGEPAADEIEEGDEIRPAPKYNAKKRPATGGGGDDEAGDEEESAGGGGGGGNKPSNEPEEDGEEESRNGDGGGDDDENEIESGKARMKHLQRAGSDEHQGESGPAAAVAGEAAEAKSGEPSSANKTKRIYKQRHKTPPTHIVGMSPITVEYAVNYNRDKHSQFVTPMFSTIVYKLDDIKEVFFLLLLLISLGEFFSAPAVTIADSITLSNLGENTDLYGRQRMFGSIGWGITLLLVGMALDNSKTIADHPCGPHQRERSYTVCFTIFSLLMGCAFLTATQFTFRYPSTKRSASGNQTIVTKTTDNNTIVTTTVDGNASATNVDDLYASTRPREIFNTAPPVNAPPPGAQQGAGGGGAGREKFEFLDKWKSAVFAQSTGQLPEWVNVFRQFSRTMHLTYLFITWFLGCGVGLVFTFLFWHLQDVGGTPTLFGICSVINHISEILAYFFSSYFIKRFGHTKVLSVGLGCNVIRFLYVAFLSNPYYALPFELVQGITHAACFAACCSYMSHVSKPELKASTQGVMQGLHNGIGRACGALIGGYMINAIGSRASFCIYGLLSGCVLGGLLYIRKKVSQEEAEVKVDDNENMGDFGAPQGVPSAIPNKMIQSNQPQDIDYQW